MHEVNEFKPNYDNSDHSVLSIVIIIPCIRVQHLTNHTTHTWKIQHKIKVKFYGRTHNHRYIYTR